MQLEFLQEMGNDIEKAIVVYKDRIATSGRNLVEEMILQREESNRLHFEVDAIENELKGFGIEEMESRKDLIITMKDKLKLMIDQEVKEEKGGEKVIVDRPALMMKKSAISKAERLLEDMHNINASASQD